MCSDISLACSASAVTWPTDTPLVPKALMLVH